MAATKQALRIAKARMTLIFRKPFFAALSLRLKVVHDEAMSTGTASTDGRHLYYSEGFIDGLSDAELQCLICHEVLHCANGHIWRRGARHHGLWNVACDYAINLILKEDGQALPKEGLLDEQYRGMAAEHIYNLLLKDCKFTQVSGGGQGDEAGADGLPKGGGWGEMIDAPQGSAHEDEAQWKVATLQAAKVAKQRGNLPGSLERLVEEALREKIDWRSALARFLQQTLTRNDYTWRLPSSRYASSGLYLPTLQSEEAPEIIVAFDTSGSCWDYQGQFFSELRSILDTVKPSKVHFIQCDTRVYASEIEPGDEIVPTVRGGGGTDLRAVFTHVEKSGIEAACMVFLSDMESPFPTDAPDYPVLWIVTEQNARIPFGDSLYIGDDE